MSTTIERGHHLTSTLAAKLGGEGKDIVVMVGKPAGLVKRSSPSWRAWIRTFPVWPKRAGEK